jgi:TonB family protein
MNAQELKKEINKLTDSTFILIEKNNKNKVIIAGVLSSIKPEIKNGKFKFYSEDGKLEAIGYYTKNIPSGIWEYYDITGNIIKEVNYNKTIEFLKADTISIDYNEVLLNPEIKPLFNNKDLVFFTSYINQNKIYPIYALKNKISGRVYVAFIIDEKGNIRNIQIVNENAYPDLKMEVLRVTSESSKWTPGFQNNKSVSVSMTFIVGFDIN